MKEIFASKKIKNIFTIFLAIFFVAITCLYILKIKNYTYIKVSFAETRPLRTKLPVFYKGYKIGRIHKLNLSDDFKSTEATLVLFPPNLSLPTNTIAIFTREKTNRKSTEYINLTYPNPPDTEHLKNGDTIMGKTTIDIESYFSNLTLTGEVDELTENIDSLIKDIKSTTDALQKLLVIVYDLVDENRPEIKNFTNNLSEMSFNLKEFALKLNKSINEKENIETFSNINKTSQNAISITSEINNITENIKGITDKIDTQLPKIDITIAHAEQTLKNLNIITYGIKKSMSKNFGGLRVLFGKSINCNKN